MQSIKKIRNLEPSTLNYGDVMSNKYGGKFLYLNDADGKVYMQLPKMKLAFKVSKFIPKDKNGKVKEDENPRFSINLSFYKKEDNPKVQNCFDKFTEVDNTLKQAGVENHEEWFPGQFDKFADDPVKLEIAVDTVYRPLIKVDKKNKGKYAPTLPVKLPYYDGQFKMELYDKKDRKNPIKFGDGDGEVDIMKYLGKGASMTPLVCMSTVNFTNGYGTGLTLVQGVVEPTNTFMGTCIIDDSDDEDETVNEPNISEAVAIVDSDEEDGGDGSKEDNVVVDSSDEEIDDASEPEPEPEPKSKRKGGRRTTRKKK
jgi:hypothetical protein